jgi:hypothetical protein
MFSLVSGLYESYLSPPQLNLLVVGAPGVGKTALLERIKVTHVSLKSNKKNTNKHQLELPPSVKAAFLTPSLLAQPTNGAPTATTISSKFDTPLKHTLGNPVTTPIPSPQTDATIRRRLIASLICPAPEKYKPSNQDQDEVFVHDDDDDDSDNSVLDAVDLQQSQLALGEGEEGTLPLHSTSSPDAPPRVRLHSKELDMGHLDLLDEDEDEEQTRLLSTPPVQQRPQHHPHSLYQESNQQVHLKPNAKMLPLSKIRPTSKYKE